MRGKDRNKTGKNRNKTGEKIRINQGNFGEKNNLMRILKAQKTCPEMGVWHRKNGEKRGKNQFNVIY